MNTRHFCLALGLAAVAPIASAQLKPPSYFATISDRAARSAALFTEAGKVIESPRCLNCHPVTRRPTQGDDLHAHVPPMREGAPGMPCSSCHGGSTVATLASSIESIPGHPHWSLAPVSMAWQGKSLPEICEQIKDRARNGGRSLVQIHEHMPQIRSWAGLGTQATGEPQPRALRRSLAPLCKPRISTGAHCPNVQPSRTPG